MATRLTHINCRSYNNYFNEMFGEEMKKIDKAQYFFIPLMRLLYRRNNIDNLGETIADFSRILVGVEDNILWL